MANFFGTTGNDTLVGTTGADVMEGGAGKDRLNGGDGDDIINGGADNDYVYGDRGNDTLYGGSGNDTVVGDAGNDLIYGEDGNDGIFGGGNDDTIYGGAGIDTMYGDGGNDFLDGGSDDDKLYGGAGNDRLFGGTGNDLLDGGAGNDVLVYAVGTGVDQLVGNTGSDTLELVLSSADLALVSEDIAEFATWLEAQISTAGSVAAHAASATGPSFTFDSIGLTVSAIEAINVIVDGHAVPLDSFLNSAPVVDATQAIVTSEDTPVDGVVVASDADGDAMSLAVGSGPQHGTVVLDSVTGAFTYTPAGNFSGSDSFTVVVTDAAGASSTQTVNVAVDAIADTPVLSASDAIAVSVARNVTGTSGADRLHGGSGDDVIDGGRGDDVIFADGETPAGFTVAIDIAASLADLDGSETLTVSISGIPAGASLSAGQDLGSGTWLLGAGDLAGLTLTLAGATDVTLAVTATATEQNGASASTSLEVDVSFESASGNDVIHGGAGNDVMHGGHGVDILDMRDAPVGVGVYLYSGLALGDGFDTFTSIEGVWGSRFGDQLHGDSNANLFLAGDGGDQVFAYDGDDFVDGGAGSDQLYGGGGNDTLRDGSGSDSVFGEAGNDTFVVASDTSSDYFNGGSGIDTIDFSQSTVAISIDLDNHHARGTAKDQVFDFENITGSAYGDNIEGDEKVNVIDGGAGNDWINSGRGADVLTGGAGNDTFAFDRNDVLSGRIRYGVDTITDFGGGDRLDFDGLISGNVCSALHDIELREVAGGTMIAVDFGGSAGAVDVVLLEGVYDLDLQHMLSSGQIVV